MAKVDPEKQKELQQRYLEFQLIEQQSRQIEKQLQVLENQLVEIISIQLSLDELKDSKLDSEILVPVSNGIFVKGELKENKELLVNVGSNTIVVKSIEETKELIGKQQVEINQIKMQLLAEMEKLNNRAMELQDELEKLIKD